MQFTYFDIFIILLVLLITFMAIDLLSSVLACFVALFAIMDPFVSLPAYIAFTSKEKPEVKAQVARDSVLIAGGLLFVFLIFGKQLLDLLGITIPALQIGGALILTLLGVELVLGISFDNTKKKKDELPPYAVLLGTPLITGPGVITTSILLSDKFGMASVAAAAIVALFLIWLIFKQAKYIERAIGISGLKIMSKIMGVILVATAAQFAITGIKAAFGV